MASRFLRPLGRAERVSQDPGICSYRILGAWERNHTKAPLPVLTEAAPLCEPETMETNPDSKTGTRGPGLAAQALADPLFRHRHAMR